MREGGSAGAERRPQAREPRGTDGLRGAQTGCTCADPQVGTHAGLRGEDQALMGGRLQGQEGLDLFGAQCGRRLDKVFPGALAPAGGREGGALGDQGVH